MAKMFSGKINPRGGGYQGNRPRREFSNQTSSTGAQLVNSLFKSQCIKYWRKLRVSLVSSGPIRWVGIHLGEIKVSIVTTIKTEDIL